MMSAFSKNIRDPHDLKLHLDLNKHLRGEFEVVDLKFIVSKFVQTNQLIYYY